MNDLKRIEEVEKIEYRKIYNFIKIKAIDTLRDDIQNVVMTINMANHEQKKLAQKV